MGTPAEVPLPAADIPQLPVAAEDAAWVEIETPFEKQELNDFIADIERLFRINPMLVFESFNHLGDERYHFSARNLSNNQNWQTGLTVARTASGLDIRYLSGLKTATYLRIREKEKGTVLQIVDDYSGTPEVERQQRTGEVDHSLVPWAKYMSDYLRLWKRWSWFPVWRWYMRRVWQPMQPSARRITYMLFWITLIEIVAIVLAVLVFRTGIHRLFY